MNATLSTRPTAPYKHSPLFPLGKDPTPYRKIADGVRIERVMFSGDHLYGSTAQARAFLEKIPVSAAQCRVG